MRKPIIAGNWKMHGTTAEAAALARGVVQGLGPGTGVEVVLCPPFTSLPTVAEILRGTPVALGAQNVHAQPRGAHTGEVSAPMLHDLGCEWIIVGHSERRTEFGETGEVINRKARAILDAGMWPIFCLGETWEQREAEETERIVERQVEEMLDGIVDALPEGVIAYEPVWAIGTGKTATGEQAQQVQAFIRDRVAELAGPAVAEAVRIQYGGSVKPENAREIFSRPDIDGGLIGGAALDALSFLEIVAAARSEAR